MEAELQRIEVDGTTYQLRLWGYEDGWRWLDRFFSLSSKAATRQSDGAAVSEMVQALGGTSELRKTVAKYTDVVEVADGRETVIPLDKIVSTHMQGRYVAMAKLMRAHVQREFGDFFGRIGEVFEGLAEKA